MVPDERPEGVCVPSDVRGQQRPVPLVLVRLVPGRLVAVGRVLLGRELARALPPLLLFLVCWAVGEASGYLLGVDDLRAR